MWIETPKIFRRVQEVVRDIKLARGIDLRKQTPDRIFLEQTIFRYFLDNNETKKILFVGCGWYTVYYNKLFVSKEWWTIEIDPRESKYGSPGRHIVGAIQDVGDHFDDGYFDVIICNGVIGWGLDKREDVDKAFDAMRKCLRPGGVLVIGYNNNPDRCHFPVKDSAGYQRFEEYDFPPIQSHEHIVEDSVNNHTYLFLRSGVT